MSSSSDRVLELESDQGKEKKRKFDQGEDGTKGKEPELATSVSNPADEYLKRKIEKARKIHEMSMGGTFYYFPAILPTTPDEDKKRISAWQSAARKKREELRKGKAPDPEQDKINQLISDWLHGKDVPGSEVIRKKDVGSVREDSNIKDDTRSSDEISATRSPLRFDIGYDPQPRGFDDGIDPNEFIG